jgi:hypothetical protein
VVSGTAHEMILRAALEAQADLVVLGAVEGAASDSLFSRSTSRAVVRRARCRVLLVPPHPWRGARRPATDAAHRGAGLAGGAAGVAAEPGIGAGGVAAGAAGFSATATGAPVVADRAAHQTTAR